ncbi:ankyrin repeat domain-containing protein, partial [uncultured Salinisphaera sp.]|uniref:ankyrin repeat domain-containing protein n=1 Tax=uncultured Salinisphaera sp. TaxID=359372 RepID=UPI0032B2FDC0
MSGAEALNHAASNGHARCIHILVEEGADIDVFSLTLRTPLNIAASGGHVDAVCALIAEGADVELSPYLRTDDSLHIYGGRTALHWAARLGNEATVIALLRGNARIDADNKSRSDVIPCTPLCEALDRPESEERDRVVHALLRGGAAVTAAHRRVSPLCDRIA